MGVGRFDLERCLISLPSTSILSPISSSGKFAPEVRFADKFLFLKYMARTSRAPKMCFCGAICPPVWQFAFLDSCKEQAYNHPFVKVSSEWWGHDDRQEAT